jgi:hypothetical protein
MPGSASIRCAIYTRQSTTPETTLSSCEAQFTPLDGVQVLQHRRPYPGGAHGLGR